VDGVAGMEAEQAARASASIPSNHAGAQRTAVLLPLRGDTTTAPFLRGSSAAPSRDATRV
jgi:hypothetical protein